MRELKIIAKTEKGEESIKAVLGEDKKENLITKMLLGSMKIKKMILSSSPLTVAFLIQSKKFQLLLNPKDFSRMVTDRLDEKGSKKDIDYRIEVI